MSQTPTCERLPLVKAFRAERRRRGLLTVFEMCLVIVCLSGCGQEDHIERYTIPKSAAFHATNSQGSATGASGPMAHRMSGNRMLAAMVPKGDQMWFFKVTGSTDALEGESEKFVAFIRSIRFTDGPDTKLEWTLPDGWLESESARSASSMRYATLQIASQSEPLELSVIPLRLGTTDLDQYVLDNVNRWRGQLQLPPISKDQVPAETVQFDVNGAPATVVDLTADQPQNHSTNAPGPSGAHPPVRRTPGSDRKSPLTYQVPEGWSTAPDTGFSAAAFQVTDESRSLQITVTGAGGDLLANVNRWRSQVGLNAVTPTELAQTVKKIAVGEDEGDYVELVGPSETILGVVVSSHGRTWFLKLKGNSDLAKREQQRFEAFVGSIQFH